MLSKEVAALTLLAPLETIGMAGNICPDLHTMGESVRANNPHLRSDLNAAYVRTALFGVGVAALVSWLVDSPLPALASALAFAGVVANYETALPPEQRLWAPLVGPKRESNVIDIRAYRRVP